MKKFTVILWIQCFIFFEFCIPIFAANTVPKMDITVEINEDGSAYITQVGKGSLKKVQKTIYQLIYRNILQ